MPTSAPRTAVRRIHRFGPSAVASDRFAKDVSGSLTKPCTKMILRSSGQITGGGASTRTGDAPLEFTVNRLRLKGAHTEVNLAQMLDSPGRDPYWLGSFLANAQMVLTAPDPGAGSANFSSTIEIPFSLPGVPMYLDPRDLSSLIVEIDVGAFADYGTNITAVAAHTCDILVEEMIEGEPDPGSGYLVPFFVKTELDVSSTSTLLTQGGAVGGGRFALALLRQDDSSATGDADRVDGLVSILRFDQAGKALLNTTWRALVDATNKDFPLGLRTTIPAGLAIYDHHFTHGLDSAVWPNLHASPGQFTGDTSTPPEQDITDVVPASGDRLHVLALCGIGTSRFEDDFEAGVAAAVAATS